MKSVCGLKINVFERRKVKVMGILANLFGTYSSRELKRIEPIKQSVLDLEPKYHAMSDKELKSQTPILKERLANGETLDDILPDAFAVFGHTAPPIFEKVFQPRTCAGTGLLHYSLSHIF